MLKNVYLNLAFFLPQLYILKLSLSDLMAEHFGFAFILFYFLFWTQFTLEIRT